MLSSDMLNKIREAVSLVYSGMAKRVDLDHGIIVYAVGNIIRIDIKRSGE